ncbi:MAG TPA: response regulator [Thermoanaerobaculia bacterium]|nr:response regulator [Thermoanaerobaculia bacterium]
MQQRSEVSILLVEDNPQDLEMTMRALRKNNVTNRIDVAKDGEEALEYLFRKGRYEKLDSQKLPDVVFLDLKLPKVDGIEVLRQIKSDPRTRVIPVVVLTSSAEETDRIESYNLGVNSYVVKPIQFDSFVRAISEVGYYWMAVNRPPG